MARFARRTSLLRVLRASVVKTICARITGEPARALSSTRLDRRRRCVGEADHRFEPAVVGDDGEIGAFEIERRLCRAARDPAEAHIVMMRLDAAGEVEAVARKMFLGNGDHPIDAVMAGAVPRTVDVASVLGPGPRHERAAPLRIALVPYGKVTQDDLVDVAHSVSPFAGAPALRLTGIDASASLCPPSVSRRRDAGR